MFNNHVGLDEPADYEIRIQGRINSSGCAEAGWLDWFQSGLRWAYETGQDGEPITVLGGVILDQAALHGLLAYIRNLGLTLLYVDCLSAHGGSEE